MRKWLIAALAALLVYALVGFFLVPWFIERQIRSQAMSALGRTASVGAVRFNPFTLAATLEGLQLDDLDGRALVRVERLRVDLQVSGLFRRAWRFREILIERPTVAARILNDGRPSVADLLESPASTPASDGPVVLPRVIVDRLALSGGVVRFSDSSRQPVYESRFEPIALDVTDLITIPEEGGAHTVAIGVGDGAVLRWKGRQVVEPLQFTGTLEISNLALGDVWDYLAPQHMLAVRDGRADITLPYRIRRTADRRIHVGLDDASVAVRTLAVRPRTGMDDWMVLPELRVAGIKAEWPESRVEVASVTASAPRVVARLDASRTLNWTQAFPPPAAPAAPSPSPWTFRVANVAVDRGIAAFEDLGVEPPVAVEASDLSLRAQRVSSVLDADVPFTAKGRLQEKGQFELSGSVAPSPLRFTTTFDGSGIDLAALASYFPIATGARLVSASGALRGQGSMTPAGVIALTADGSVDDVKVEDLQGASVAAWRRVAIEGLTLDEPPTRARVRRVVFDRAFATVHIDRTGNLNLASLFRKSTPAASGPSRDSANPARVEVGEIVFRDASADFTDESMIFDTFRAQIHSANGSIRDVSSFAAAPATIGLEGRVDKTGFVKVGGVLRLANPMASSEVTVGFRSIDMAGLTPYFAEFAGYRVKNGVLDLDVRYQVKDRRLVGNHTIVARDLALGDRVKDSKGPGFAVRLAVALLKDREGRINLDVPIEGSVDAPEFGYRKVFWAAMRTILGNAAKAPFRAIGRLFGRDEEDLELVEFDPGRETLLPAEQDKLTRLAEQLASRQDLTLSIEGRFDPKSDQEALRRIKLDTLIESRRAAATAAAAAAGTSTIETILTALFTEQFGTPAADAERARFTTAPAAVAGASPTAPLPAPSAGAAAPAPAVSASATASTALAPAAVAASPAGDFDAAGFYESLRAKLLEAQTVAPADLAALATARASTIRTTLTSGGNLQAARVTLAEPAQVKRGKAGSTRIASELTMSAGQEETDGDAAGPQ